MLPIDTLTAYVICGAGSVLGAGILRLADSPRADTAAGLRLCTAALLLLGISLLALLGLGPTPWPPTLTACGSGTLASMVLLAWGVGRLAEHDLPSTPMITLVLVAALGPPLAVGLQPESLALSVALGLVVTSLMTAYFARRFILAPDDMAARALGVTAVVLVLTSVLRAVWTWTYRGLPQTHLLHVPAEVLPFFAVLYGVLPIVVSTLLLTLVNGQFRQQLSVRALTDELTGLLTRRALREQAADHIQTARAGRLHMAVLMLDLDHFKRINDRHGHAAGDLVLRHAAALWRDCLRPNSLLARYGGEEFVALVPVEDLRTARLVAERLRTAVAAAPWAVLAQLPAALTEPVTASIGTTLIAPGESLDDAVQRADEALYRAKREGRNQVQVGLAVA